MARGKKRTLEEEVAELNRRASESQEKLMMTKLQKALKVRPSMIIPCWEKVLALGYVEDDPVAEERGSVPVSKQKQARIQRASSMKSEPAQPGSEIGDPLNMNWSLMSHMTIPFLQSDLLPCLEPSVLSAANLRCHEKSIGKPELMEIVEFLTGLADWQLKGPHRSKSAFLKFLQERYGSRGRRGGLLVLPPVWEQQGLYCIDAVSDVECTVRNQYSGHCVAVALTPQHAGFEKALYVDNNYSEARSALRVRGQPQIHELSLMSVFAGCDFITPEKMRVKSGMPSPCYGVADGAAVADGMAGAKVEGPALNGEVAKRDLDEELHACMLKLEVAETMCEQQRKLVDESALDVPPPPADA
eukprot:2453115-Amphidinium_carterae.1